MPIAPTGTPSPTITGAPLATERAARGTVAPARDRPSVTARATAAAVTAAVTAEPTPAPTAAPTLSPTPEPAPVITASPTPVPPSCDPSYPTVCIAPPPPDLNCADVPYKKFQVLEPDPHGFDNDNDGVGCES